MSARRATVVLTPEAEADLESIVLYGRRTWGDARAKAYADKIRAALRRLAADDEEL